MHKRGQIAVFVVVGVVLIILIGLIFYFRDNLTKALREKPTNVQEYLTQQLSDIKKEIGRCATKETSDASKLLMENGGNFDLSFDFIRHKGVDYAILCREFEDSDGCLSEPILISKLSEKLNNYLPDKINKCLNLEEFKNNDYTLKLGSVDINTDVTDDFILANVDYSIELKKNAYSVKENNFVYKLDIPLGSLTKAANNLVQKKAIGEDIDPILFGLLSMNKYSIKIKKPYPDELYDLSLSANQDYHFYFAIEGTGRYPRAHKIQ